MERYNQYSVRSDKLPVSMRMHCTQLVMVLNTTYQLHCQCNPMLCMRMRKNVVMCCNKLLEMTPNTRYFITLY